MNIVGLVHLESIPGAGNLNSICKSHGLQGQGIGTWTKDLLRRRKKKNRHSVGNQHCPLYLKCGSDKLKITKQYSTYYALYVLSHEQPCNRYL